MAARVGELFGGSLDVLVNNAGYNGKCQLVRDMKVVRLRRGGRPLHGGQALRLALCPRAIAESACVCLAAVLERASLPLHDIVEAVLERERAPSAVGPLMRWPKRSCRMHCRPLCADVSCGSRVLLVHQSGWCMLWQEDWEFTMKVNLTGTMLVSRELIPLLERASGNVCNVASNVARRGLPYRADYVCSKWAIIGLTQVVTSSYHHLIYDDVIISWGWRRPSRTSSWTPACA